MSTVTITSDLAQARVTISNELGEVLVTSELPRPVPVEVSAPAGLAGADGEAGPAARPWDSGTTYVEGEAATLGGVLYVGLAGPGGANIGHDPSATLGVWWAVALANPVDGSVTNAKVPAGAGIAGSKISPDFGAQNIVTTGTCSTGALTCAGVVVNGNAALGAAPSSYNSGSRVIFVADRVTVPMSAPVGGAFVYSESGRLWLYRSDSELYPIDGAYPPMFFGDGYDGAATISSNTTLTRDMFYTTLDVLPGVTLSSGGYRIHATRYVRNDGVISKDGLHASGATAGAGAGALQTAGASGPGGAGGASGNGLGGNGFGNLTGYYWGGSGGTGGAGAASSPGVAGVATALTTATWGTPRTPFQLYLGIGIGQSGPALINMFGGAGGSGGGGGPSAAGGGGGGGAAVLLICAPMVFGSGVLRALGGNGAAGLGTGAGGGGGGGGGVIGVLANRPLYGGLTTSVAGGTGGASGGGSGAAGAAGSAGKTFLPT